MKTLTSLFGILLLCPVVCSGADYGQPASTLLSPYAQHQYTQVPVYVMPYSAHLPQSTTIRQRTTPLPTQPSHSFVQTADLRRTVPATRRVSQTESTVVNPVRLSRPTTTSAMLDSRFDTGSVYR